jgi:hypothetical protein
LNVPIGTLYFGRKKIVVLDPDTSVEKTIKYLRDQQGRLRRLQDAAHNVRLETTRVIAQLERTGEVEEVNYEAYKSECANFDQALQNLRKVNDLSSD